MNRTKKLTAMGILTAVALILFTVEAQIPSLTIPGIKLGLANIVTLVALLFLGRKSAGLILAARIFLGSLFAGSFSTILFSAAGGLLCYIVMSLLINRLPKKQLWVISILGAMAHNLGQLLMAAVVLRSLAVFAYGPILLVSAIITGAFTGIVAYYLSKYQKWFIQK